MIINHVNLSVTQGEILGLLGTNGAGKNTILHSNRSIKTRK
ncbi:hypothetical protein RINTHH_2630 [Richelia intracellularis HH01]|uniref:ABC transporter domain-containing protein n=1 Tax=Richelia intracellularis HH01 TaxID=1165094 RepID=M1WZ16_9NOST|nr:hypothetical protein RINTHH_2630 [Richelia intracellularis HH01]